MIKRLHSNLAQLLDLSYTFRFIIRFAALYFLFNFIHYAWLGITAPGGDTYSPFLGNYLNYVAFIREACLKGGMFIAGIFGVDAYLVTETTVSVSGSGRLFMGLPCIGLELLSFWGAFVIADTTRVYKKIVWCLIGWLSICTINCLRVGLLIIALKKQWQVLRLDQHTLFNICAYTLIFVLIFIYYRRNKKQLAV